MSEVWADLVSPPHHEVGEDPDPHDGADKRHSEILPGCLENADDASHPGQTDSRADGYTHHVADVGEREPQREDDGQQQQIRDLFAFGFRPL